MDIKSILPWFQSETVTPLLALDVGSRSIKLVQIRQDDVEKTIEIFALLPLPIGLIEKDTIKDPATLAALVKSFLQQQNIASRMVAIAIPRSAVIIKNILLDKRLNASEIESRIWLEASQQFPDLIGEINLDYDLLGATAGDPSKQEVVLVACRKEQMKPYFDFISAANLIPGIIDVNCYAFERALSLENNDKNTVVAILNIDYTLTSLLVMENEQQIFAHDYVYDGYRLYELLTSSDPNVKRDPNDLLRENFSTHLRHCMHLFYSSRHNIIIEKIYVSGDLSKIAALTEYIQNEFNIKTKLAKPLQNMKIDGSIDATFIQENESSFALACGLALSELKS